MDFEKLSRQLVEVIENYEHLLIYIKGSPDPDAIAGSVALKLICHARGRTSTILCPTPASLPENIKLIKDLHLPVRFANLDQSKNNYDAYAIMDHQSVAVDGVTGVYPCALHVDHHEPGDEEIPVDLKILTNQVGSTSTLMVHLALALGVDFSVPEWTSAVTALYYGIQSDTDYFQHCEELDRQAAELIVPFVNKKVLDHIASLPFSNEAIKLIQKALKNHLIYKDWMICGIGYIKEKNRDNMGIIGDFLLKRDEIEVVVVFGIVERDHRLMLDASFRTTNEDLNLNTLIKKITRNGGARKFKGAYQVNLDYFSYCPNRDLLWETVYSTTIETLKNRRDDAVGRDLTHLFRQLKRRIQDLFH